MILIIFYCLEGGGGEGTQPKNKETTTFDTFFLKAQVGTNLQHDFKVCYAFTPYQRDAFF